MRGYLSAFFGSVCVSCSMVLGKFVVYTLNNHCNVFCNLSGYLTTFNLISLYKQLFEFSRPLLFFKVICKFNSDSNKYMMLCNPKLQ